MADALLSGSVGMITIQTSSTSWILFQTSQFHCLHFLAVTRIVTAHAYPKHI